MRRRPCDLSHHDRFAKAAARAAIQSCVPDVGPIQVGGVATAGTMRARFRTLGNYDAAALSAKFEAEYERHMRELRHRRV